MHTSLKESSKGNDGYLGGANSRVIECIGNDGIKYIKKLYFLSKNRDLHYLQREFQSIQFMNANGITNVPSLISKNEKNAYLCMEYIPGRHIDQDEVTMRDVDQVCVFLTSLHNIRNTRGSRLLPFASEARFSFNEIVINIKKRLDDLSQVAGKGIHDLKLQKFLQNTFIPVFKDISLWCETECRNIRYPFNKNLAKKYWTLSPSDFGFHNAIRRNNGSIVFIDFEHFGWDDPMKMISDFLLHPRMNLSTRLKRYFVNYMLSTFKYDATLHQRLRIGYPLFGLKWCLIFLNEFLPEHLSRRRFAQKTIQHTNMILTRQLEKSRRMLHYVKHVYKKFPYA